MLAGAIMVAAGLLRLGRYVRFVSHSVMIGFLTGVAANIIFGQIADLTGADAVRGTSIARAIDVLTNPSKIITASLLTGLARSPCCSSSSGRGSVSSVHSSRSSSRPSW